MNSHYVFIWTVQYYWCTSHIHTIEFCHLFFFKYLFTFVTFFARRLRFFALYSFSRCWWHFGKLREQKISINFTSIEEIYRFLFSIWSVRIEFSKHTVSTYQSYIRSPSKLILFWRLCKCSIFQNKIICLNYQSIWNCLCI